MSKRKDALQVLLEPVNSNHTGQLRKPTVQSGALNSMNSALNDLALQARHADELASLLANGETIIDIAPENIDPSPFKDRLDDYTGPDFSQLLDSLRYTGQMTPVLVRPHPETEGRFQTAFGHRRIEAMRQIGKNVRAIVRELTDDQLALAQGTENTERKDLSFIERSFFALKLEEQGIRRDTIMRALATSKGVLSQMISIARQVPTELVYAIGPAPLAGRPRWEALIRQLDIATNEAAWRVALHEPDFASLDTNQRFERILKRFTIRSQSNLGEEPILSQGKQIAGAKFGAKSTTLTLPGGRNDAFTAYVLRSLPEIHRAFEREQRNKTGA